MSIRFYVVWINLSVRMVSYVPILPGNTANYIISFDS